MGCGGIQPRETDFVWRAWCGRGLRDRHPSTTRPTARSLPLGARAPGRQGGASTPSRSHSPRTSSARLVDRTATGATRPWRRQRATASRPLAGPRPARTLTNSPRDTSSCTSDGPLISCRDRAPAAVTVAREPTAASSQPKGCAPTPAALVRGCGQAYALQTVEPVTYRCGTRRVCQARSSGSERDTRARPHAVAPMNCVPEDSRRRSTCTGRTHSPRARADGTQTPSSTVAVRAPSPS